MCVRLGKSIRIFLDLEGTLAQSDLQISLFSFLLKLGCQCLRETVQSVRFLIDGLFLNTQDKLLVSFFLALDLSFSVFLFLQFAIDLCDSFALSGNHLNFFSLVKVSISFRLCQLFSELVQVSDCSVETLDLDLLCSNDAYFLILCKFELLD